MAGQILKHVRCFGRQVKPEGQCRPDVSDLNPVYIERKLPACMMCPLHTEDGSLGYWSASKNKKSASWV